MRPRGPGLTSDAIVAAFQDGEITFGGAAQEQPEIAWAAIVALSRQHLDPEQVAVLAAGPLEDLLAYHGPSFIDRVEKEARVYAAFRHLLGGVWPSSIKPEVWRRVEKIRGTAW
jgi:hypothetical protein